MCTDPGWTRFRFIALLAILTLKHGSGIVHGSSHLTQLVFTETVDDFYHGKSPRSFYAVERRDRKQIDGANGVLSRLHGDTQ